MARYPNPKKVEELFDWAVRLGREERLSFLDKSCGDDHLLRKSVEEMLLAHETPTDFLPEGEDTVTCAPKFAFPAREISGAIIGRYKLLGKLGEGGFGVVWAAEQKEPVRRRVALKVIKLGMDTQQVIARFEAERQALALMDHPNIAKVLDAGITDNGRPYFVMELVRGISITKYCKQEKLNTRGRLDLFIKVCHAIQHAHQKGVIHRDIKPPNVMITLHDGEPVPKVIDFGIAKATQADLTDKTIYTQYDQFIGTPAYMSPEQAEMSGLDIDTRADIYSLGVLLYELLTGTTPFDGRELLNSGVDEMRKIIREQEPLRPSTKLSQTLNNVAEQAKGRPAPQADDAQRTREKERISEIRGDLDWVVMKCLEKDRGRRYETASELAQEITRHLNNEEVLARPPSTIYRFQKAWRRNRLACTSGLAVAAALVIGIIVSLWQANEAMQARNEANASAEEALEQKIVAQEQASIATEAKAIADQQRTLAEANATLAHANQEHSRRLLYAADMNLANQALGVNNLGRARRLLDRHRPQPGDKPQEDLRGWEWRYLWKLSRSSEIATLTTGPHRGKSVSLTPDGKYLAVGWSHCQVDLWNPGTRRHIRTIMPEIEGGLPGGVEGLVKFSPDGKRLAGASPPEVVWLHDIDKNETRTLWKNPHEKEAATTLLSFSPDGSKLLFQVRFERNDPISVVHIFDVESMAEEKMSPFLAASCGFGLQGGIQLSPDNKYLYTHRNNGKNEDLCCIDIATGMEKWRVPLVDGDGLTALALSPDGKTLLSTEFAGLDIHVWNAETGDHLKSLQGHTGWIPELVYTRDGSRFISAGTDQTIRVWDTESWEELQLRRGHPDEVEAVDVADAVNLMASVDKKGLLKLWDIRDPSAAKFQLFPMPPPKGYGSYYQPIDSEQVLCINYPVSPDSGTRPPIIGNVRSGQTRELSLPGTGPLLKWYGSDTIVQSEGKSGLVFHALKDEQWVRLGAIQDDGEEPPRAFSYDVSHKRVAWARGGESSSLFLERLDNPGVRIEIKSDLKEVSRLEFSDDGRFLLAGGQKPQGAAAVFSVWDVASQRKVAPMAPLPDTDSYKRVIGTTFAEGGSILAINLWKTAGFDTVFFDLNHPEKKPNIYPNPSVSYAIRSSPDGARVIVSDILGFVRVYDAHGEKELYRFQGHLNGAFGVDMSGDGQRLITASGRNEAIKLWDLTTQQELLTLKGKGSSLRIARWMDHGNAIIAYWPFQLWRAPSWEEIDAFEARETKALEERK